MRLRGEDAGRPITWVLEPGETRLGSSRSNTLVLAGTGISRHHAVIELEPESSWPTVRDLDSKNGTTLDGQRVTDQVWTEGVELVLGAARLWLERIEAEDVELGMVLDGGASGSQRPREPTEAVSQLDETTLLSGSGALPEPLLALLDTLVERLTLRPQVDLDGALTRLFQGLGGLGAGLVEWPDAGSPRVLAATGAVGALPTRAPKALATDGSPRPWLTEEPEPMVAAVRRASPRRAQGLVVWGDFPLRGIGAPLLGVLLRWIDFCRPRSLASLEDSASTPRRRLVFPPHIVRGEAPTMVSLYQQMEPLLDSDLPVLVLGETGVGKEHLARLLHDASARSRQPFVAINCAAIPTELLEAEMFGIGRGVATGVQPRRGKFAEAHRGTLFLDEVGDLAPLLQAKLLRAIQEKEVTPMGAPSEPADVRLVAATNGDLEAKMEEGEFRRDLYYRIAGDVLRVPPLRQRRDDIPRLLGHFLRRFSRDAGKAPRGVTVKALQTLTQHPWPGNVRQLEHAMRRLVHRCPDGAAIDFEMLSPSLVLVSGDTEAKASQGKEPSDDGLRLAPQLEAVERRLIPQALVQARGNQTEAARLLGVSRNGLAKRLKRLGIRPDDPWG